MIKLYFDTAEMWRYHLEKEMKRCTFRKRVKHIYAGVTKGKYWYRTSMY